METEAQLHDNNPFLLAEKQWGATPVRLEQVLLPRRQEDHDCSWPILNMFPLISVLNGSLEIPKNNLSGSWPLNTM